MNAGKLFFHGMDDRSEDVMEARQFWLDMLSGDPKETLIQPDHFQREVTGCFERISFEWPLQLSDNLQKLSQGKDTLLYSILLSGILIVLNKYSGETDMMVASPPYIGFGDKQRLNRYLPIRCHISSVTKVKELLVTINQTLSSAYRHQYYPLHKVMDHLELNDRTYAKMACELTNIHDPEGFKACRQSGENEISFTITRNSDRIEGYVTYDAALFTQMSVQTLLDGYTYVIEQAVANPNAELRSLELVKDSERERMISEFNQNTGHYLADCSMSGLFEAQVAAAPDRIAVVCGEACLTYGELNEKANRLAHHLQLRGVSRNTIVGVMLGRSLDLVTTILAVLKAGGAYLPLDPTYPEARLRFMLEDSGAAIVVTSQSYVEKWPYAVEAMLVGEVSQVEESNTTKQINDPTDSEDQALTEELAYIIYTSGSTGTPKGVKISHRGMANLQAFFKNQLQVSENDKIIQFASASFDASVWEIFMALFTGAELHLPGQNVMDSYDRFTDYLNEKGITIATLPPTFAVHLEPQRLHTLRMLITAGSAAHPEMVQQWRKHVTYYNAYGPTETTICATIWSAEGEVTNTVNSPDAFTRRTVPIGKPILNTDIYILNHDLQLQPIGVMGELCIGGSGLAEGYLGREELTAEKFIPNPFKHDEKIYKSGDYAKWMLDGNIEYLGRMDHQVKIRGYRIELGEIEIELLKHPEIEEVIVTAGKQSEDNSLYAYYVAYKLLHPEEIKEWLAARLPSYMIPQHMVQLQKLPLTVNGKVDLADLPDPKRTGGMLDPHASETERLLAELWCQVLGVNSIGSDAHFFDAGGHSLRAAMIISDIHKTFQVQLTLRGVMEAPTLREMAARIEESRDTSCFEVIVPASEKPYYPLSLTQKRLYVLSRYDTESVTYNLPVAIRLEGTLDMERLKCAFQALVDRHETLRTSFGLVDGVPVQYVHPKAEVSFEVIDKPPHDVDLAHNHIESVLVEFIKPFDLSSISLLKVRVLRYSADSHMMLLDMHHIISDGISMSNLINNLLHLYQGIALEPLLLQYKDFACWQNDRLENGLMEQQERYWLTQFTQPAPTLNMKTDFTRSDQAQSDGDAIVHLLTIEQTQGLRKLASLTETTLYMVLLSAYSIVLSKYSGQDDIVIGTPVAGRRHADLQSLIGMFINILPMRTNPASGLPYASFLRTVKETSLQAFEHQDYPFDELVRKLSVQRDVNRNPLFEASFALQNMDMTKLEMDGVILTPIDFRFHPAKFDLTLWAEETVGELRFILEYRSQLFKRETVERMLADLVTVLNHIVAEPQIPLGQIELLNDDEKRLLTQRFVEIEQALEMEFDL